MTVYSDELAQGDLAWALSHAYMMYYKYSQCCDSEEMLSAVTNLGEELSNAGKYVIDHNDCSAYKFVKTLAMNLPVGSAYDIWYIQGKPSVEVPFTTINGEVRILAAIPIVSPMASRGHNIVHGLVYLMTVSEAKDVIKRLNRATDSILRILERTLSD